MMSVTEAGLGRTKAWDERYYAHVFATADEYQHTLIVETDGDYISTSTGERLVDFTSGLLCVNAGQRNQDVRDAIVAAMDRFGFVWEGFANPYRTRAAKLIMEDVLGSDGWAGRIRFTSSGSEAVELALLVAKTVTRATELVSRDFAYHGWTHGALSLMGLPGSRGILAAPDGEVRRPPGIPMPGVHFRLPLPIAGAVRLRTRTPSARRRPETFACIAATEHMIRTLGSDTSAAVVVEPIFGVGMIHPPAEYLGQLRELTRDYGILLIDDEVMTGFGRTGRWFAYQHSEGVTPDLMAIGKGVVSAALPVGGGLVISRRISDIMDRFRWETVSTFAGHPITMAAVEANVAWMLEERIPERAEAQGKLLGDLLVQLRDRHPSVDAVQGAGLLWPWSWFGRMGPANRSSPTIVTRSRWVTRSHRHSSSPPSPGGTAWHWRRRHRTRCASDHHSRWTITRSSTAFRSSTRCWMLLIAGMGFEHRHVAEKLNRPGGEMRSTRPLPLTAGVAAVRRGCGGTGTHSRCPAAWAGARRGSAASPPPGSRPRRRPRASSASRRRAARSAGRSSRSTSATSSTR